MTTWGIFKTDSISESYKKMKDESLKGDQHKLDKNKNGKLDKHDFKLLRKEDSEQVEEGWDDMLKSVKDKNATQPNGGSGKKQGSRYGGGKQKDDEAQERKAKKNESVELEELDDGTYYDGSDMLGEAKERNSSSFQFTHKPGDTESEKKLADLKAQHKGTNKRVVLQGRLGKDNPNAHKYSKEKFGKAGSASSGAHTHQRIKKADAAHHDVYVYDKADTQYDSDLTINELKKSTLASYATKATKDLSTNSYVVGITKSHAGGSDDEALQRRKNRSEGLPKAISRLAKEEVQIDEAINSDDYRATSEPSQFGGHRAIVKHKAKGTTMYAGGKRYATAEKAKEGAHTYLHAYEKHGANAAMSAAQDHGKKHGIKESIADEVSLALDEEKQGDIVKMGAKEIKHANMKDKQDDAEIMEPHSEGEANFIDQHYVDVTDDATASKQDSGASKLGKANAPKGQGAGKYDGKNKTGVKESTSEEGTVEEACSASKKGSGKKTFSSFKAKVTG